MDETVFINTYFPQNYLANIPKVMINTHINFQTSPRKNKEFKMFLSIAEYILTWSICTASDKSCRDYNPNSKETATQHKYCSIHHPDPWVLLDAVPGKTSCKPYPGHTKGTQLMHSLSLLLTRYSNFFCGLPHLLTSLLKNTNFK